jgi:hypothetical protein
LAFVLSTSALADGVLHTDKNPPPPPPTQANSTISTGVAAPAPEEDTLLEIALTLLQTLIPLL